MSQVRPVLSPLLVGRDDLLLLAERRIAEVAEGRGQLLLLAGEAGVGKTRLLRAVIRKAQGAGFRVAKGDLAPQDRQVPLALIRDLARTMRELPPELRVAKGNPEPERVDGPASDAGGRQGPASPTTHEASPFGSLGDELLAIEGGQGGDTLGSRRVLVIDIATRIIAAVDRPTVLAFEDLQWADEMSLEVLGELARLAHDRPLLLLGVYRSNELPVDSYLREWRARLLTQRLAEEARLGPLSYDETALVTTLILGTGLPAPREVVNAVYERTDGIPLHIEELLGALDDAARADGRAIREAHVPSTIQDAILARAARLSPEARLVARAGAVIGRCFVPEVLAGLVDRPVADLDGPLEELVANAFIYPFEFVDRGYFDFRHQLLRDTLYETVPARELRRLHARAGEFGAELVGASEIHASVHFERAGLRAQAYRAALAGARAASAVSSRREAFELYRRAAANAPDDLTPLELAELYDAYGEAASAIDSVAAMEETARIARANYLEAGRPVEAAIQLVNLSAVARKDLRPPVDRLALLEQAEAELAPLPDSPERTEALALIRELQGVNEIDAGRLRRAAARFEDMGHLLPGVGPLDGDAPFNLAHVDALSGRAAAGFESMLRWSRIWRDADMESAGVTAFRVTAALAARLMDYRTAEIALAEGLRYADEIQQSYCRHVLAATSAQVAWTAGRWDDAVRIAEIELVEPGSLRGRVGSRHARAFVAFGRGDLDLAREHLAEALAVGEASGELEHVLPPRWGLAETALLAGDPAAAVRECEAALVAGEPTDERALLVPFVVTGVRAYLADRRPEAAEAWLERLAAALNGWDLIARPAFDHADGLIRLSAGSTVMARASLERAIEGWERLGRTWESSWARLDLAACLLRANRPAEALPVLREVQAVAERLGSSPLLARVDELSRLARSRGAEEEPWRPLTAREFEIARMVAEGMTNNEIANRLSLSPKTVSAHVEHILAKLGAGRRTEIAAWTMAVAR